MSKATKFKFKTKKKGKSGPTTKVARKAESKTYVEIIRPVQHVGRNQSFYRCAFNDLEGNPQWLDVPRKSFAKPGLAVDELLNAHAELPLDHKQQKKCVIKAVKKMGKKDTLKVTDRLGWNEGVGDGRSFVYFDQTFGASKDSLQLDHDANRNSALGKTSGTVDAWTGGLAEPCEYADQLLTNISIAASGPLYGLIGNPEPAIYQNQGAIKPVGDDRAHKSSSGKTLSARAAQSMFGSCALTDLHGFNTTEAALEETCFSCNNLLLVLDEEGTVGEAGAKAIDPKTLPYRILAGQGKRRSKAYAGSHGLSNRSWVLPVIATSEEALDQGKSVRKEGAQVRMIPIPFPPTYQGGMFSKAKKGDRARLAKLVEDTISENFGVAMPKLLECLVRDRHALAADILKLRNDFVKAVGVAGNSWETRYAEKFAMVLAGARLMVRYGIAPWTDARAIEAVTNMYRASRSLTVSADQATEAFLGTARKLVKAKVRFPKLRKGASLNDRHQKKAWGVIREVGGKKNVTAIRPARFNAMVVPSAASDLVLEELDSRKLLVKDPSGALSRQLMVKGLSEKRARYVCVRGLVPKKTTKA